MGFFDSLFEEEKKKKVFISFAIEDVKYRDFLVKQAKQDKSPFEFIDMSAKKAWKQSEWQKRCRTKIKGCDGVIVLLSKNIYHASGARWEMKCTNEEKIPMIGMHIKKNDKGANPPELYRKRKIDWTWENIEKAIETF
ncbi:MAG: TIR domain-containing protein [Bacteroidales bacterium]|nr:TIR domain-containing protein [Bacteroidales bacterium]